MSAEEAALFAAWTILLVLCAALAPRLRRRESLERPEPQPLHFDPLFLDLDGPIIDLEPA